MAKGVTGHQYVKKVYYHTLKYFDVLSYIEKALIEVILIFNSVFTIKKIFTLSTGGILSKTD